MQSLRSWKIWDLPSCQECHSCESTSAISVLISRFLHGIKVVSSSRRYYLVIETRVDELIWCMKINISALENKYYKRKKIVWHRRWIRCSAYFVLEKQPKCFPVYNFFFLVFLLFLASFNSLYRFLPTAICFTRSTRCFSQSSCGSGATLLLKAIWVKRYILKHNYLWYIENFRSYLISISA